MDVSEAGHGRFAYDGLDRVIHEKARLSVLTSLVAHPKGLVFADLKKLCGLTDGNLSRHLQVLQDAGLVEIEKGYERNRPQTVCRITEEGRRRYLDYLAVLEQVVRDAAEARKPATPTLHALRAKTCLIPLFYLDTLQCKVILNEQVPMHVAIIMDGNGRWATRRGDAAPLRPSPGRRGRPPRRGGGARPGDRHADAVRLLLRQLAPVRRRGPRVDGAAARVP